MLTCYECDKIIKGEMILHVPSRFSISFGDFERAYHPKCNEKAEREAETLLSIAGRK